ncbi:sulfurtransferase complex subunit TusB [Marinobacter sp.]|uniref:sulfurtransferase complex subunit TusB n=1 Tax=Marinobacter sp. TaxID=50741 RepID=UPI0034A15EEA
MTPLNTLHILNKPPNHSRFKLCLAAIGPADGVLLTENGVLAVTQRLEINGERWFALAPDLEARGLLSHVSQDQVVSFDDMVDLTASAENVISW